MTTVEILNGLRSNDLDLRYEYGSLDDDTRRKIEIIKNIYSDDSQFKFPVLCYKVLSLYYLQKMTAEEIAEKLDISPRTVYRKRDEGIRRLSDILDE